MRRIETVEELKALYGMPVEASIIKVRPSLTLAYRRMIEASPFVALFAEVGRVVGITADGGVVEGRHSADAHPTIVDGPLRRF